MLALGVTSALGLASVNAATYKIIDKGDVSSLKYTYAQQENNLGEMAISGTELYNFPVQFQYLKDSDFDAINSTANTYDNSVQGLGKLNVSHTLNKIEDFAALKAGNPTANDLEWAVIHLRLTSQTNSTSSQQANSTLYQKVGTSIAMVNINGQTEEVTIFDTNFDNTSTLTRSTTDFINGITDDGWLYGNASAPYLPMPYTKNDGDEVTHWLRAFTTRGYFSPDKGQTIIPLLPPETTYGGESSISDISSSNIAVGYASTGIAPEWLERINNTENGCANPDLNEPVAICVQKIVSNVYHREAFKWLIDANGEVSSEGLGFLVTPHVDDTRENVSFAQAVNNHGVAVGFAYGWVDETQIQPSKDELRRFYAVVYKEGQVVSFTKDQGKEYDSRAFDINDRGIAVGLTYSKEFTTTNFYYIDTSDVTNMTMEMPKGFFTGSTSVAMAINENNLIVGKGEVETHSTTGGNPRRTHGFMYDIAEKTFTDLNDFLPCTSKYTIFAATDINEHNEISASAIVKIARKDSKGELMQNAAGEQLFEDVIRAVKLAPITGEIENCTKVEAEKTKRQGAGLGLTSIAALLLLGLRRRFFRRSINNVINNVINK
ncbi:MAG: hypothetical protein ACI9LM_004511 [Alteromonadaceae bacterium]|jgi:hypothetical protein